MLDRDFDGYYEIEKALIKSSDVISDDVYKLKNVLATDYILLFNVADMVKDAKSKREKIQIVVDYRVLLFATRQIKYSNTISMKTSAKNDDLISQAKISEKIAKRITDDVVNAIYPLEIASINGNEVIFSQTLTQGDIYECFALGEKVQDAYTKEAIARAESKSGEVKITRSTQKLSYASILSGSVKKGDICRLHSNSGGEGMEASHTLNDNGTVNLGW